MKYRQSLPSVVSVRLVLSVLSVLSATLLGCSKGPARLIDKVKEIPLSGGHDTMYMERSEYWDRGRSIARTDSNRQTITFKPAPGSVEYVTLKNMGGVPLKRDTIRSTRREAAETFLRTGTLDTNMHLHIESADWRVQPTDVVVYIRNRDSVYREFLFFGR